MNGSGNIGTLLVGHVLVPRIDDPPERGFEREIRKRLDYWDRLRREKQAQLKRDHAPGAEPDANADKKEDK